MKTLHPILAALALVVFVACQVPSGGTGSLKISLPAASRAVSPTLTQADVAGKGDKVRLQLVRNGITVPLSGNDFLEENLSGQTVALDGLPTGTNYRLYAATGAKTADGKFFQVAYYQVSAPFEISSGVETAVGLTLSKTPVHLLASGPHSNASVAVGSVLHETDSSGYRTWTSVTAPMTSTSAVSLSAVLASGRTLNSMDKSPTGVFFNTSGGLGTGNGTTASMPPMVGSDGSTPIAPNVTKSGSFTSGSYTLSVYAGSGLTAGVRILGGALTADKWYDLESLLKVDTLPASVKDSLSKSEGLFRDFAVTGSFAYIATALGTYRVDGTMLTVAPDSATGLGQKFIDRADDVVLTATLDGRTQFIQSVSAFQTGSTAGMAFAGTSRGLFSGTTDNTGVPTVDLALVNGTFGLDIVGLATTSYAGSVYTAAYSDNTHEILILTGTGNLLARYPVLAGFPTGTLSLSWWPVGGHLKLAVSGDNGTVYLDVAYDPTPA